MSLKFKPTTHLHAVSTVTPLPIPKRETYADQPSPEARRALSAITMLVGQINRAYAGSFITTVKRDEARPRRAKLEAEVVALRVLL